MRRACPRRCSARSRPASDSGDNASVNASGTEQDVTIMRRLAAIVFADVAGLSRLVREERRRYVARLEGAARRHHRTTNSGARRAQCWRSPATPSSSSSRARSRRSTGRSFGTCNRLAARWSPNFEGHGHRHLPRPRSILCDLSPKPFAADRGHILHAVSAKSSSGIATAWVRSGGLGARSADSLEADECRRAGTMHLGGTLSEIAASEKGAWEGRIVAGRSCC